jgi:hypothetical protein
MDRDSRVTSSFALLLDRCGLSVREAAAFLRVREDTVKSWRTGRNPTPPGVFVSLRTLYAGQTNAAGEALALLSSAPSDMVVELGLASDDAEAQLLGFPCVGAHAAVLGMVVGGANRPVRIVPRGSTPVTAAAADAHGR